MTATLPELVKRLPNRRLATAKEMHEQKELGTWELCPGPRKRRVMERQNEGASSLAVSLHLYKAINDLAAAGHTDSKVPRAEVRKLEITARRALYQVYGR